MYKSLNINFENKSISPDKINNDSQPSTTPNTAHSTHTSQTATLEGLRSNTAESGRKLTKGQRVKITHNNINFDDAIVPKIITNLSNLNLKLEENEEFIFLPNAIQIPAPEFITLLDEIKKADENRNFLEDNETRPTSKSKYDYKKISFQWKKFSS